jgi:hypothetical protein
VVTGRRGKHRRHYWANDYRTPYEEVDFAKAKNKTFYERKNQNLSDWAAQSASRRSALSTDGRDSAFRKKETTGTEGTVSSGSISGASTIGNENPFQAHSVLETSSEFRLILRLENALWVGIERR